MSELRFEVRRTREDIWNGIAASLLRSPSSYTTSIVGALVVAGIAVFVNLDEGPEQAIIAGALVACGMALLYVLIYALCILVAVQKTLKLPGALELVSYAFSSEGLSAAAASGHGQSSWELWPVAFETNSIFVIRHQLNLLQIIPKRDLSPDLEIAVRSTLTRYVKKTRMQKAAA